MHGSQNAMGGFVAEYLCAGIARCRGIWVFRYRRVCKGLGRMVDAGGNGDGDYHHRFSVSLRLVGECENGHFLASAS